MVLGSKSAPHSLSYSVQKELDDKSCCWERVMARGKDTNSHNQERGAVFPCVDGTRVKQCVLRVGLKPRAEDIPNPLCLLP